MTINITESPRPSLPLLRSVSLPVGKPIFQPVLRRRCTSNEPGDGPLLEPTVVKSDNYNGNKAANRRPSKIEEEQFQDVVRWANLQALDDLPCVPDDQPLMPTKMTLCRDIPLSQITQTIVEVLHRLQSQGAHFTHRPRSDHAGRIDISCIDCHLKFVIQLWRSQDDKNGPIVVELQRRRGCPVFMHFLRRPLFKALETMTINNPSNVSSEQEQPVHDENEANVANATKLPPTDPSKSSVPLLASKNLDVERPSVFPPPLRSCFQ